jgi:WD40 repeat protein
VQLWETTGGLIAELEYYGINSAGFSPDGTNVVVAAGARADLWTAEGEFIIALEGHSTDLTLAAFSPDGSKLLTAGRDGTTLLWPVPGRVDEMLAEARRLAGRSLTAQECRQYLGQACLP